MYYDDTPFYQLILSIIFVVGLTTIVAGIVLGIHWMCSEIRQYVEWRLNKDKKV